MDGLDVGRWMVVGCLVAVGCNALAEDAGEGQSDASSTSDEGQDDASSTSDDGQDADPSLEVCAELPAAALTGWREGPREPSTAT